jgi:hypothetical protein
MMPGFFVSLRYFDGEIDIPWAGELHCGGNLA